MEEELELEEKIKRIEAEIKRMEEREMTDRNSRSRRLRRKADLEDEIQYPKMDLRETKKREKYSRNRGIDQTLTELGQLKQNELLDLERRQRLRRTVGGSRNNNFERADSPRGYDTRYSGSRSDDSTLIDLGSRHEHLGKLVGSVVGEVIKTLGPDRVGR